MSRIFGWTNRRRKRHYYWRRLSAVPEAEQCGWLKYKYGLSWQIVPSNLAERLANGPQEENRRVMDSLLEMKKIDLVALAKKRFEA